MHDVYDMYVYGILWLGQCADKCVVGNVYFHLLWEWVAGPVGIIA